MYEEVKGIYLYICSEYMSIYIERACESLSERERKR